MRILVVGAGGVGSAIAVAASRRDFFERLVVADLDATRARRAVEQVDDRRFDAATVDAASRVDVARLARECGADTILNACDPRLNPSIFDAALEAGTTYIDMAMTLSRPHPERPYEACGVKLGDDQFARAADWEARGLLALCGLGVEPGFADVAARYAADHLFSTVEEVAVRDGANLRIDGYSFAPTFSIWTVIEECLNPPVVWERGRGWYCLPPFSEPETFTFPAGIGDVECVHVEHEEVVLVPRWIDCDKVTFKYGLGDEFIEVLSTLHLLGLDRTDPVSVRGVDVAPRDVVAACLPDPRRPDARRHVRRHPRDRNRHRRQAPRGVPASRLGQRGDDGAPRLPGGRLADRDQPGHRDGVARARRVVRERRRRPGGVRRGPLPRSDDGLRRALAPRRAGGALSPRRHARHDSQPSSSSPVHASVPAPPAIRS
jgi:saccharopine dehydrogenase-like NADP-dependent oxidoreductase